MRPRPLFSEGFSLTFESAGGRLENWNVPTNLSRLVAPEPMNPFGKGSLLFF